MGSKRYLRVSALIAAACFTLAACGSGEATDPAATDGDEAAEEAPGPEVTLTLGHPFPATHVISEEVLEPFFDEVQEATQGRVNVEIHPGGALGGGEAMYENVVAGAQDIGFALHGYTAGRFPIAQVVELPFMFPGGSAEDATRALWQLYEEFPEFQDEYGDVKVLALWTHEPGYIWTKDARVDTADDLQGLTLRAPGPITTDLIDALDASAVGMPAPEAYDALERGVIDGLMIAENGVNDFNLFDVLDYGVACDCYTSPMFVVMNQQEWDALSPEQQAIIDDMAGEPLSLRAAQAYDEERAQSRQAIDDAQIEIVELDDGERERWREIGQSAVDGWIDARESEGTPGQAMYDRLAEIVGMD